MGRDFPVIIVYHIAIISTHTPAWGATYSKQKTALKN